MQDAVQLTNAKKPLIGITCGEIHNEIEAWSPVVHGQSKTYIDSIIAAGGVPVLIPLTEDKTILRTLYELLDGVCLAGGNDLTPDLYGQEPIREPKAHDYSALRDSSEHCILHWALTDNKPVLGICRGMQLINIELGGTLFQDIEQQLPGKLDHDGSTKLETLVDLSHQITIEPGTKLADTVGSDTLGTNAHHHQAIDRLGTDIIISARATDEIIEGLELTTKPFVIGVQSHPESLTIVEPRWARLFERLVAESAVGRVAI